MERSPAPFDRYQYFDAWLTRLSIVSGRKSPNMISMIGRSPQTALPNAAPAIASSEIGVSNTPRRPVLGGQFGRHREHTSGSRDVLAEEDHALVARELLVDRLADRVPEFELLSHGHG